MRIVTSRVGLRMKEREKGCCFLEEGKRLTASTNLSCAHKEGYCTN